MCIRITKVMGESFKLHSQALVGYEDDPASPSQAEAASRGSSPAPVRGAPTRAPDLEMEVGVY
jgi:hypothetical protein